METALAETRTEIEKSEPWDRLEGESPVAYSRFLRFLHLGPRRSLLALHRAELAEKAALAGESPKKTDSTPSSLRELAAKFAWFARAGKFQIAENEADQAAYAESRRERRHQLLESEWGDSQALLSLAREALQHGEKFISRRVVEKPARIEIDSVSGEKVQVIERVVFVELKTADIIRAMKDGSQMARKSVDFTPEKAQEFFANNGLLDDMDIEKVDAELEAMFDQIIIDNQRAAASQSTLPDDSENPAGPTHDTQAFE